MNHHKDVRQQPTAASLWRLIFGAIVTFLVCLGAIAANLGKTDGEVSRYLTDLQIQVGLVLVCIGLIGVAVYSARALVAIEGSRREKLGLLVAALGHDIRGPMSTIQSYIALLGGELSKGDRDSFAKLATKELAAINIEIEDLMRVARSQPVVYKARTVNVNGWFDSLRQNYAESVKSKGMQLGAHCSNNLPALEIDANRLERCIDHLVANATKHSGASRINISVTCDENNLAARAGETTELVVAVSDDGCGIPKKDVARVFEAFESGRQKCANKRLGFGLAFVESVAKAAGGTVVVDFPKQGGMSIAMKLPVKVAAMELHSGGKVDGTKPETKTQEIGTEVLLVVNDLSTQAQYTELLKEAGFSVDSTDRVEVGLEKLASAPYRVIVSELGMPIVNGYTYAEKIRKPQSRPYFIGIRPVRRSVFEEKTSAEFEEVLAMPTSNNDFLDAIARGLNES